MLSAIGRSAVKRIVAGGPQSTNRAFQTIWQLQRVALSQQADNDASQSYPWLQSKRSYATATKATQTTKSKSSTTAKPKAKKAPAKTAVKKPVKKAAKKPVKMGRPALKKKPVKKPVRAKKVLTEAQKERALIKELKAKALTPPKLKPYTAWTLFAGTELTNTPGNAMAQMGSIRDKYKELSPSEIESLNHTASQNKVANTVAYKQWVESHTPDQIRIANNARAMLKKKLNKARGYTAIKDARLPKRSANSRALFTKERYASGDFKGISIVDASKLLTTEWNSLSPSERKVYEDRAAADTQRYVQEFKTVFHKDSTAHT
ncbi:hypothetical protein BDZ45DRAFT_667259 [Acephala macrosclerotiorum]|nr:hypothetical protein BDZ45DRAFT_667259 [Acephala macrosclerotiorum]